MNLREFLKQRAIELRSDFNDVPEWVIEAANEYLKEYSRNIKAKYVSVWDDGIEIRTNCEYNPVTNDVTNIESVSGEGLENLEREYVELPNGTEIKRKDFTIDGIGVDDDEETNFSDEEILRLKELVRKQN